MQRFLWVTCLIATVALAAPSSFAGELTPVENACLGAAGIQEALSEGHVLKLAAIRQRLKGDIVRADLCRDDGKLDYRVTVLAPDGAVRRMRVDATSGEMLYGER